MHWTSNALQLKMKILTQKNNIFHHCLLHVIHDALFLVEFLYVYSAMSIL